MAPGENAELPTPRTSVSRTMFFSVSFVPLWRISANGEALLGPGAERDVLESIPYQPNRAYLHTDAALMPRRSSAARADWRRLRTMASPGQGPPPRLPGPTHGSR